jgi:hypothetical protein
MDPQSDINNDGAMSVSARSLSGTSSVASGHDDSQENNGSATNQQPEQEIIAKEEDKAVFLLKLLVLAVLVVSTVGVAVAVYLYTSGAEEDAFEEQFVGDSSKIFESIGSTLDLTLGAVDSFLVGLVSFARFANATWPQVTLPDYAVRVAKIRSLSKAVLVTQYHFVASEQRAEWESYSVANDYWVDQGIEVQRNDANYQGKILTDYWTRGDIHVGADPYTSPGPYLPKWQQAPVIPTYAPYNWDAMSFPSLANAWPFLVDEHRVVMSQVTNLPDLADPDSIRAAGRNNEFIQDYIGENVDVSEPFGDLYYPILDTAADSVTISDKQSGTSASNVVGIFAMTFYWRDLLKDILPPGSHGAVVVVGNDCNQTFSYKIDGASVSSTERGDLCTFSSQFSLTLLCPLQAIYLGPGDHHETKFESLGESSKLRDLDAFSIRDDNSAYTGLRLSMGGCQYALQVYPSSDVEDDYITSNPIIFTSVAVLIFVFTSVIFLFYDRFVEKRQKKVMTTGKCYSGIDKHAYRACNPAYSQLKMSSSVFMSCLL